MAKIQCPYCGAKYDGKECPVCKAPAPPKPKKKKKWLLPVIIVVVIALIAGMSGGDTEEPAAPEIAPTQAPAISNQTTQETEEPSEASTDAPTEATTKPQSQAQLEEAEIYNANGISVTVKKLEKGFLGQEITVTVSNDSEKNVIVTTRQLSVNGCMLDTASLYAQVAAGKKANESILFLSSELEKMGIRTIADVEFYVHVADSDTFADIHTSELIKVSTSASGTFQQTVDDSGEEVFNNGSIRIVSKGFQDSLMWDGTVLFLLENNSSDPITVHAENVSVNGFMVDEGMWSDLRPGTYTMDGMYLINLEDLDITDSSQIEEIEFTLRIVHADTWYEIAKSDVITLTFSK